MARAVKWLGSLLLLLPVLAVATILIGLNTGPGRRLAEALLQRVTDGQVTVAGLGGRFPDSLRLAHLEVKDARGAWLVADDVALDWSPGALLHRQALVHSLTAGRLQLSRLPASAPAAAPSKPATLPVRVTVEHLAIGAFDIGWAVLGAPATLTVAGKADLETLQTGGVEVTASEGEGAGSLASYTLRAAISPATIDATLDLREPAHGLIARLAALPDVGPLHLHATAAGPQSALTAGLALTAGPLTADASATIDLLNGRAIIDTTAAAPAMTPAPGVSWRSVALQVHSTGPFTAPEVTGHVRVEGPAVAGATLRSVSADIQGNAGQVTVAAVAEALRLPGPDPALLEAAPLHFKASVRLDDPARPVRFSLDHPLLRAAGVAKTAPSPSAQVELTLPDLAPIGALAAIPVAGSMTVTLNTSQTGETTGIAAKAVLALTAGPAPAPALLGPRATLSLSAELAGDTVTLKTATLAGAGLAMEAHGASTAAGLDVTTSATIGELSRLAPAINGAARLAGHIHGPADALAAEATLDAEIGGAGFAKTPIRVEAALTGLPGAPAGHIAAQGTLAGAPLNLALDANRTADGALHATITQAGWRTIHAEGALTLLAGATLPNGRIAVRIPHLEELRPFLAVALSGAVSMTADLADTAIQVEAEALNAGVPAARVGRATLKARITDPLHAPAVSATLDAAQVAAGPAAGSLHLDATGPQSALALKVSARVRDGGNEGQMAATGRLDAPGRQLRLETLQVTAGNAAIKPETTRLVAPATLNFANGLVLDRLRLVLRQATLDVSGRLSPTLDATIALRTPAEIAAIFGPEAALDGAVAVDAHLTGTAAQLGGQVKLSGTNLRARAGPGRALSPANLAATAQLGGGQARVEARLSGPAQLTVTGTAPLAGGAVNLRASGSLDLALLDPVLTPSGRRARGRLALDAAIAGSVNAPVLSGSAQLSGGELQDFSQGVRITDVNGTVRAEGQTARVALIGRAAPGTLAVAGTIGIAAPNPVDLAITLRNARPLASDTISADLDADLTVRGPLGGLEAAGRVLIRRAELRIPKTLPASVVVLNVRRPGDRPAVAATSAAPVRLALTIDAPQAVYVRGRGVDAELAGSLRIRGTSLAPQVGGGLEMRRGTVSVAGTTLNFSRGRVGFDGTGVTGKIDPTLDFAADSTAASVTATLAITGYVSKPVITLSSVPGLPQDEVLAYLLFKRSAKELGPFQLAEIAAALAELTGVGGGGSLNPLESVRKGLGLDRLSVGAGSGAGTGAGTGASTAPTIEAGRYVGNGVYVGAKQGATGGQTQATVQIDITKGLKLETDVGTGQGGNQVGLTYEFEY